MQAQALQLDLPEPQHRKRCAGAIALAHVLTAPRLPRARSKQAANLPVEPAPPAIQAELALPVPAITRLRSAAAILAERQAQDRAEPEVILIVAPAAPMPECGAELDIALGDPEFAGCEPVPPDLQQLGGYEAPDTAKLPYWVNL